MEDFLFRAEQGIFFTEQGNHFSHPTYEYVVLGKANSNYRTILPIVKKILVLRVRLVSHGSRGGPVTPVISIGARSITRWLLDRPVKPGDDTHPEGVILRNVLKSTPP
jgi:hypothetical protein